MNFNTLNNEPLTSKTGNLAIALYPNMLVNREDGKKSYYARVINRSRLDMEDIADDMVANGVSVPKADIIKLWKMIDNAVTVRLCEGITVDTGLGVLRPTVTGTFESEHSEFDRSRHTITVQYRPNRQLAKIMASLTPVIAQGNHVGPEIISVRDLSLGELGTKCLGSGNFFSIRGKNLLVLGEEGTEPAESAAGLYFVNLADESKSVRLRPDGIYHNTCGLLEGIIPQLESGASYKVRVVTRYVGSKALRKVAQEHTFGEVFTAI